MPADSWFLTVFIFWMVTLAANLLMGVGTFGGATNARELEDALVARGAFSSSLVLAYVFVVPAKCASRRQSSARAPRWWPSVPPCPSAQPAARLLR